MNKPMQVLGLCRFSYPAHGGFQTVHETLEERTRFLYADERLEERFRIFESFTLPSLMAQTDPDFTLIVVIGKDMPRAALQRLRGLLAQLPQAVLRPTPPGKHRWIMRRIINEARRGDMRPCIQFRMDDDDAVACDFVAKVRTVAGNMDGFLRRHPLAAIDFNCGHVAQPGPKGILAEAVRRQYWVPSLAVVAHPAETLTVMNFNHLGIWRSMPTVSLNEADMFVRGISSSNDSGLRPGPEAALLDPEGEALFRSRYNICADRVRALFQGRG